MNSTVRCLARPDIQVGGERFPRMEPPPPSRSGRSGALEKRLGMMHHLGTVVMKFIFYKYSMIVSTVRLSNCFYVCTRTHSLLVLRM